MLGRWEIRPGKTGVSQIQCRMGGQGGCAYQLSVNAHSPIMFSAKQQLVHDGPNTK